MNERELWVIETEYECGWEPFAFSSTKKSCQEEAERLQKNGTRRYRPTRFIAAADDGRHDLVPCPECDGRGEKVYDDIERDCEGHPLPEACQPGPATIPCPLGCIEGRVPLEARDLLARAGELEWVADTNGDPPKSWLRQCAQARREEAARLIREARERKP